MEMSTLSGPGRVLTLTVLLLLQFGMRVVAVSQQIINVDTSGSCSSTQILNGGFAQSFKTNLNVVVTVGKFEIYLDPNQGSLTSYQAKLYVGSGCSGTLLATSLTTNIAAASSGGASAWYPFSFQKPNDAPLYPNTVYTIQVSNTSSNAGSYNLCNNKYSNGNAFSNSCTASANNDISFRLTIVKFPRIQSGTIVSLQTRTSAKTFVSGNNFPNNFDANTLAANRQAVGQYESFSVEDAGNGLVALRCVQNNLHVRYDSSHGNELRCDISSRTAETKFMEADVGNAASGLQASNGLWVGVDTNDRYVLKANQASVGPGPEEAFSVSIVP